MEIKSQAEIQLTLVLARLRDERESLQLELNRRIAEKEAEISAVLTAIRLVKQAAGQGFHENSGPTVASSFKGMTQRKALVEIARRNGGNVRVSEAKRLLISAGLIKNPKKGWGIVYTTLSRSSEFEKIGPGEFRLNGLRDHKLLADKAEPLVGKVN